MDDYTSAQIRQTQLRELQGTPGGFGWAIGGILLLLLLFVIVIAGSPGDGTNTAPQATPVPADSATIPAAPAAAD